MTGIAEPVFPNVIDCSNTLYANRVFVKSAAVISRNFSFSVLVGPIMMSYD
jgi:hypothetical protein